MSSVGCVHGPLVETDGEYKSCFQVTSPFLDANCGAYMEALVGNGESTSNCCEWWCPSSLFLDGKEVGDDSDPLSKSWKEVPAWYIEVGGGFVAKEDIGRTEEDVL